MNNVVKKERLKVPQVNWRNYDKEMNIFINEVKMNPGEFEKLTSIMWKRIKQYQQYDLSHLPIELPRIVGEDSDTYLDRIYKESGYSKGV